MPKTKSHKTMTITKQGNKQMTFHIPVWKREKFSSSLPNVRIHREEKQTETISKFYHYDVFFTDDLQHQQNIFILPAGKKKKKKTKEKKKKKKDKKTKTVSSPLLVHSLGCIAQCPSIFNPFVSVKFC